jgi:DNA-binding response OmpR family regulator
MRILVMENDAPLADFFRQRFAQEQFSVQIVADAGEAERQSATQAYDAVLLDVNQGGEKVPGILRGMRANKPDLPVIIITSSHLADERVRGLNAGADDYIAKPFSFAELVARIRAVLRRGNRPARAVLRVDDLELDRVGRSVRRGSHYIDLSPKEFALLEYLMRHQGQPVTRSTIIEQVWRLRSDTLTNVVDVYINYIRSKVDVGHDQMLIRTVRGVGYQIGEQATPAHVQ